MLQVLQHASPAHLTSLTAALDQLDERYAYDVNYLNGFIKWRVCLPALLSDHLVPYDACLLPVCTSSQASWSCHCQGWYRLQGVVVVPPCSDHRRWLLLSTQWWSTLNVQFFQAEWDNLGTAMCVVRFTHDVCFP